MHISESAGVCARMDAQIWNWVCEIIVRVWTQAVKYEFLCFFRAWFSCEA